MNTLQNFVPFLHLLRMPSFLSRIFLSFAGPLGRLSSLLPRYIIFNSNQLISTHFTHNFLYFLEHNHLRLRLFNCIWNFFITYIVLLLICSHIKITNIFISFLHLFKSSVCYLICNEYTTNVLLGMT